MELQPDTTLGNFFNRQHRQTSSYQIVHAVTGHRDGIGGSHVFKLGVDVVHAYDGTSESRTILIERPTARSCAASISPGRPFRRLAPLRPACLRRTVPATPALAHRSRRPN
jgi:hypothetical protein